jgi:hypothetical protein
MNHESHLLRDCPLYLQSLPPDHWNSEVILLTWGGGRLNTILAVNNWSLPSFENKPTAKFCSNQICLWLSYVRPLVFVNSIELAEFCAQSFGGMVVQRRIILLMLYAFFWAIPRRLEFICRCFGTLCLFHLHRQVGVSSVYLHLPTYEDGTNRVFRNVGI